MAASNSGKDKRAFNQAIKAARIGEIASQYEVGLMYANGVGVGRNLKEALVWIGKAAERGHPAAQYLLASRYASGLGIEQDDQKALLWFHKAADQGHDKATLRLAKAYLHTNEPLALQCLGKAAQAGLPEAHYLMALHAGAADEPPESRFHRMQTIAEMGWPAAQCWLADAYAKGNGVEQDMALALTWYRKAAAQDHAAAQIALEYLDSLGMGRQSSGRRGRRKSVPVERRDSDSRWAKAAEAGDADARYHVGLMYELGAGVEHNPKQAQAWYLKAAGGGHAKAQCALGRLNQEHHPEQALAWYRQAAEQGEAEAQLALSQMLRDGVGTIPDALAALRWQLQAAERADAAAMLALSETLGLAGEDAARACLQRAAELGEPQAQLQLGKAFLNAEAQTRDPGQALRWFRKAADQGLASAQAELGFMHAAGIGTPRDLAEAAQWLEKAALQGDAKAQWSLGGIFVTGGDGIAQNLKQAALWCRKSAQLGYAPAQATLAGLYARSKRIDQALPWWRKAAEQGDPEAQYNLALVLSRGQDVTKDAEQALAWFAKASHQGVAAAQCRLGLIYGTGDGVPVDPIEACKWFMVASAGGDATATANCERARSLLSKAQLSEAQRRAEDWMQQRAKP